MQTVKWMIPVLLVYLLYTFCKDARTDIPLKQQFMGTALQSFIQTNKINEAEPVIQLFISRVQGRLLLEWSLLHRPQWPSDRELAFSPVSPFRHRTFSVSPVSKFQLPGSGLPFVSSLLASAEMR